MDYELQRSSRRCAATGRDLQPGETVFTTLSVEGPAMVRRDYAREAWQGPPEHVLGWWRSQVPTRDSKKVHWAPNDVMLAMLEQLEDQPAEHDLRYVLSLLLVRRRVLRLEEVETDAEGNEVSHLHCSRRETTYRVKSVVPDDARAAEIQERLSQLLTAGSGAEP